MDTTDYAYLVEEGGSPVDAPLYFAMTGEGTFWTNNPLRAKRFVGAEMAAKIVAGHAGETTRIRIVEHAFDQGPITYGVRRKPS